MSPKSRKGYYVDGEFVAAHDGAHPGGSGEAQDEGRPSRTARKNASADLQRAGEALVELRADRLAELDLPERLRDAIVEAKRLSNFGAKRRQLQFIGKLMRKIEPEVLEAVEAALRAAQPGRSPRGRAAAGRLVPGRAAPRGSRD
jgi:ribosome-associated protein